MVPIAQLFRLIWIVQIFFLMLMLKPCCGGFNVHVAEHINSFYWIEFQVSYFILGQKKKICLVPVTRPYLIV